MAQSDGTGFDNRKGLRSGNMTAVSLERLSTLGFDARNDVFSILRNGL